MTLISTSRSQSQRLIDCGVDPKTADMCWTCFESDGERYEQLSIHDEYCYEPGIKNQCVAWSLSAMLSMFDGDDFISITKHYNHEDEQRYSIDSPLKFGIPCLYANDPIECAVQMIEWLTSNGYKLNEIEK